MITTKSCQLSTDHTLHTSGSPEERHC